MVFTIRPLLRRANIHLSTDCSSSRHLFLTAVFHGPLSFTCILIERLRPLVPPSFIDLRGPLFAVIARNHTRDHYESEPADAHFFRPTEPSPSSAPAPAGVFRPVQPVAVSFPSGNASGGKVRGSANRPKTFNVFISNGDPPLAYSTVRFMFLF